MSWFERRDVAVVDYTVDDGRLVLAAALESFTADHVSGETEDYLDTARSVLELAKDAKSC